MIDTDARPIAAPMYLSMVTQGRGDIWQSLIVRDSLTDFAGEKAGPESIRDRRQLVRHTCSVPRCDGGRTIIFKGRGSSTFTGNIAAVFLTVVLSLVYTVFLRAGAKGGDYIAHIDDVLISWPKG